MIRRTRKEILKFVVVNDPENMQIYKGL